MLRYRTGMSSQRQQLEFAMTALQAQRERLGNDVTETALAPLRAQLAALADAPATDQTLRQVTILFLDVVGSTALAQRLDAEDVHAAIDGLLADCTAVVEKHHGKVLQYAWSKGPGSNFPEFPAGSETNA